MRHVFRAALVVGVIVSASAAQAQPTASSPESNRWRTLVYPVHAWVPIFGADVRLPEQPGGGGDGGGVTIPSAKVSSNFDGAALAGFRVERRRLAAHGEFLWAGMSGEIARPRAQLNVRTIFFKVLGSVQVTRDLYIDGGVRRFAVKMDASILEFPTVDWKPGFWEPVIGATYRPELGGTLRLIAQADLGGLGQEEHRTWTAKAIMEWQPIRHLAVGGGYGVLYLRVDGEILVKPVHLEQTLHGPTLTIGIPF